MTAIGFMSGGREFPEPATGQSTQDEIRQTVPQATRAKKFIKAPTRCGGRLINPRGNEILTISIMVLLLHALMNENDSLY